MKCSLTFVAAVLLISLISLASTVKVLLKLPGNSDTSTFLVAGDIDIVIGSDWVLTISKNEQIVNEENHIRIENMPWYLWDNVESFEFQFFTKMSSELTNLHELVDPAGSWIRVKNFKITEKSSATLKATVKCAEQVLLKKVINNDLTIYGIGSIRSVQTSNWTLLIKYTQGLRNLDDHEGNATVSAVNHDRRCWLENGELEFTLTVNDDLTNSSESETIMYWLRAKYVSNGKLTDSTGVEIAVTINEDQISLIKKNKLTSKTFKGCLTFSQSILVLILSNKSEIAELQDAYTDTSLPILQLVTETSNSSAAKQNVVIDFKSQHKHKTVLDETLILVFNYWNATSDGKSRMSVSRCYLAYGDGVVPFAIAKIMWDQATSTGSIWITKVWDKNTQKYTVPQSSTLFDEIKVEKSFNVTRRTADGKAPNLPFDHKQWATVKCLTSKHNSFAGQVTIEISFGVKISLKVKTDKHTGGKTHEVTGFFDFSNNLLTLTTKNEIWVFEKFQVNTKLTKLPEPLPVQYKVLSEMPVNEILPEKFYVVEKYSTVYESQSVLEGAICQYSCKWNV